MISAVLNDAEEEFCSDAYPMKLVDDVVYEIDCQVTTDYQFYTGKNFEQEGMIALLNYREDGITPYFTLFKDGLIEEKV
ncbi:unnamed protein product [Rhizophagus irregularis]|nr:unnamed protein product [Rhizophagus irregularis]